MHTTTKVLGLLSIELVWINMKNNSRILQLSVASEFKGLSLSYPLFLNVILR